MPEASVTSSTNIRVSSDQFVELVEKSELVAPDAVRRVRAAVRDSLTGELPNDPRKTAAAFVEEKLLTQWQADLLLRKKHKGFQLGKYRLLDEIGSGGMSRVYLGEHTLMRRRVAIKVLPPRRVGDSSYLARFQREAEAIAQLDHPNIVRAFDIDHEGHTHYFVMEYIDGRDFLQIVKAGGPVEYRLAAEYIAQMADALHHAHEAGLIHRDIKPGNCMVEQNGTVKLLDLGLAKFAQDTGPSLTLMHEENVLGTADYLAPEQARDSHTVDHRADIYSLGCTFYFLLTGHAPFPTGTLSERLIKHQRDEPEDIRNYRPDVPQDLVDICSQMMRKAPDKRFQDGGDVARRLRAWLEGKAENEEERGGPFGDVWRRSAQNRPNSGALPSPPQESKKSPRGNVQKARNGPATQPDARKATISSKPSADALPETSVANDRNKAAEETTPVIAEPPRSETVGNEFANLPSLSSLDLGNHQSCEAGSHFLPRRYSVGDRKSVWIWVGVALSAALFAILAGVFFVGR